MPHNPYAPPAAQEHDPSLAPAEPEPPRRSSRTVVVRIGALLLINFLRRVYLQLWHRASFVARVARGGRDLQLLQVTTYGMIAGSLLSVGPVALMGDGRGARALLLGGILLGPLAALLLLVPAAGPFMMVVDTGLMQLGITVVALLVTTLVLRAVTVRGAFIAMMLLDLSEQAADVAANLFGAVLTGVWLKVMGAVGLSALAILPWLLAGDVRSLRVSYRAADPLARPPLSRGGGVLLIGLLAAALALAELLGERALRYSAELEERSLAIEPHLAAIMALVLVPLAAYRCAWSPSGVMIGGMATTAAAGGLLVGALLMWGLSPLGSTATKTVWTVGYHGMMALAAPVLIRQGLPVDRLARWFAFSHFVSYVLWAAAQLSLSWMPAAGPLALAATGGLLLLAAGLWRMRQGAAAARE